MNLYVISGNLGSDREVGTTKNGKTYCQFSVAVKSGFGDNQKTLWVKCAIFGKPAEGKLTEYLIKGSKVSCHGEADLETWTDQNGDARGCIKMFNPRVELLSTNQQQQPQQYQRPQQQANHTPHASQPSGMNDFDDDSIPF